MIQGTRVLIVDDEPLVLDIFEKIFSETGVEVFLAPDARQALAYLNRIGFDAIVCDVALDGTDGFGIAAIARNKNPEIGVVLATGSPSSSDFERAQSQSAEYISKPISVERLRSAIQISINRAKNTLGQAVH